MAQKKSTAAKKKAEPKAEVKKSQGPSKATKSTTAKAKEKDWKKVMNDLLIQIKKKAYTRREIINMMQQALK